MRCLRTQQAVFGPPAVVKETVLRRLQARVETDGDGVGSVLARPGGRAGRWHCVQESGWRGVRMSAANGVARWCVPSGEEGSRGSRGGATSAQGEAALPPTTEAVPAAPARRPGAAGSSGVEAVGQRSVALTGVSLMTGDVAPVTSSLESLYDAPAQAGARFEVWPRRWFRVSFICSWHSGAARPRCEMCELWR